MSTKNKTLCCECSKRVGFYGIQCKCVDADNHRRIFCSTCICVKQFASDVGHACTFDYKQQWKDQYNKDHTPVIHKKVDIL
jgi:hypothetical protein